MKTTNAYRGALQLSAPAGWDQQMLANVAESLADDIDPDRHAVAHTLWAMGAPPPHEGCRCNDDDCDADYQNDCGICEGYLLAIADRMLAYIQADQENGRDR